MNWLEEHLPDGLKDVLCEPDAPSAKPVQNAPQPVSVPYMPVVQIPTTNTPIYVPNNPAPSSVTSSAVSSILADLRSKTDFNTTPVGQQLKESLDALADTGMSEEMMSRTAMKLTHQSPAQVVSALQVLQTTLIADKAQFEASMGKATVAEVAARQAKSHQLAQDIEAAESKLTGMRQEKSQVDSELQQVQDKISSARANYAAASEARNTEITEMISHYQNIPEVK